MNITFIIGNGFDLNLGLPTDYNHFYRYYSEQPNSSENIKKLKENINQYKDKEWKDLELGLGKFTSQVASEDEFREDYIDLQENLSKYLKSVDNLLSQPDEKLSQQQINDFVFPENYLPIKEKEQILSFKESYKSHSMWNLNIINFNYTHTIEHILNLKEGDKIGQQYNIPIIYRGVNHIHRTLDDNGIWIGVNDESQIENVAFREAPMIKYLLIKPFIVSASGNKEEIICERIIADSNLICIFGSSLGETDEYWVEKLTNCLITSAGWQLIYFTVSTEIYPTDQMYMYQKECIKDKLLHRLGIPEDRILSIQNRVHIVINSSIFRDKEYFDALESNYNKVVHEGKNPNMIPQIGIRTR